ncbi:dTDP-glucose 4,6-dehydratase [Dongia rigui]|uniref:dTDP-glucose 4,6-dehydratase n=1 Tax=Dongia rigui TaxID=940149 RepID=A0ABU5DTM4_9PROT|nr:dTDP-glucose 4,6-dehydratase [Dongia rigui]MDY0870553.1 dTDP-glucose 4,6-dehydratase [Dongia rigui]
MANRRVLVTGGAGFIGSALCRHLMKSGGYEVLNLDKLTYAADLAALADVAAQPNYALEVADICAREKLGEIFARFRPEWVFHLAAETHVDRSIDSPDAFIETNVVGTQRLLGAALDYWRSLGADVRTAFRFIHVSTDEVYGTLGAAGSFTEESPYRPNSPYAASKASADHLARAWQVTYGLPVIVSNCSNNYGPYQFPEKLIPHMIIRALKGENLPVYGTGENVRDWLFVDDHVTALLAIAQKGRLGEKYNVGGHGERRNIDVVRTICGHLDRLRPRARGSYADLITFVTDRPGHDLRYAIDPGKTEREIGWRQTTDLDSGLAQTIAWYVANEAWWQAKLAGGYRAERLGAGAIR